MSEKAVTSLPAARDPETRLFVRQAIEAATLQIARRLRAIEDETRRGRGERPDFSIVATIADRPLAMRGGVCFVLATSEWYHCVVTGTWVAQATAVASELLVDDDGNSLADDHLDVLYEG